MDAIDVEILELLAEDSSSTATSISSKVNLSVPAINKRIAKLKDSGVIMRFTIQADPQKVDKPIQAFILLVLARYSQVDELMEFVNTQKDVVECYAISGEYDYIIKVYAKDIKSLENMLLCLKKNVVL